MQYLKLLKGDKMSPGSFWTYIPYRYNINNKKNFERQNQVEPIYGKYPLDYNNEQIFMILVLYQFKGISGYLIMTIL